MSENLVFGLPPEELGKVFRKVIDRAWFQPSFFPRLQSHTHKVLAEMGWNVPEGQTVRYRMDTNTLQHVVIPAAPPDWGDSEVIFW